MGSCMLPRRVCRSHPMALRALLLVALGAACAVPAPEQEPQRAGAASTSQGAGMVSQQPGQPLPGQWTVVARRDGTAVLALHPTSAAARQRAAAPADPASLDIVIHAAGGPPRTARAELISLELPGLPLDPMRPLRVGRVAIGSHDIYFTAPGWAPVLLPSPTDPNLYLFEEANALWAFRPGEPVRRLTAERSGEFDRAQLAARQREGEVILYWATSPVWSPDGRTIAYVTNRQAVARAESGQAVWLLDPATGREQPLLNERGESFRPIGWLGGELLFTGPPGVGAVDPSSGARRQLAFGLEIAIAADGSAVALADNVPHATRIQVLSAGAARTVPAPPSGLGYAAQAVFSPSARRLLVLATAPDGRERRYFIFERESAGLTTVRLPDGSAVDWPSWLDDDTLLVPTIDETTRAVSSWIVEVPAPGA